ncbi:hypothetical protein GCM10025873_09510 [Demequina sediminis]|nr:hypothetical protein GCM10025873_09510 [Demequina sediminis]
MVHDAGTQRSKARGSGRLARGDSARETDAQHGKQCHTPREWGPNAAKAAALQPYATKAAAPDRGDGLRVSRETSCR